MSEPNKPVVSMASVNGLYLTRNTLVVSPGGAPVRILQGDARRYFVRFEYAGGGAMQGPLIPGPVLNFTGPFNTPTFPIEYKWRDCPGIVIGEFYAWCLPSAQFFVIESLFVGNA